MADYIKVKAPRQEGVGDNGPFRTILWEKHPDHPKINKSDDEGEIFISADGKAVTVGQTAAVKRLLASGALVNWNSAAKSEEADSGKKEAAKPEAKPHGVGG